MTDWADGIETRNYGIKCKVETGMLMDLMRIMAVFSLVAGALLFYSWTRSRIISTGYEIQNLFVQEESLLRTQNTLILEEETLRNPQRIDAIARDKLGMAPLRANQLIPQNPWDVRRSMPDEIAMADSGAMDWNRAISSMRASGSHEFR